MAVDFTATATLDGETVDATVYEDTDSDGTAENQETVTLSGGTNTYTLSSLEGGSGNDYWVKVDLSSASITGGNPTLSFAEVNTLENVDSGTITTASASTLTADEGPLGAELVTDVTLDGETVEVKVYEDTDGDGTAENSTAYLSVDGGQTTTELVAVGLGAGNDYWVEPRLSSASVSGGNPTATSVQLQSTATTDSGSITTASASTLTAGEQATLTATPSVSVADATLLAAGEQATLSVSPSLVAASAAMLGASETTIATAGAELVSASVSVLSPDEIGVALVAATLPTGKVTVLQVSATSRTGQERALPLKPNDVEVVNNWANDVDVTNG